MHAVKLLLLIGIFALAVSPGTMALGISPSYIKDEVFVGDTVKHVFRLTNTRGENETFILKVEGKHPEFVSLSASSVTLPRYSSTDFSLVFFSRKKGTYNYNLSIESQEDKSESVKVRITINVLPIKGVELLNYTLKKINDRNVLLAFTLTSFENETLNLTVAVKDFSGKVVKGENLSYDVYKSRSINHTLTLPKLLAGTYYVSIDIDEFKIHEERSFTIEAISNVKRERRVETTNFKAKVEVKVENEGNVIEDYVLSDNFKVPQFLPFYTVRYSTPPQASRPDFGNFYAEWRLNNFKPGDTFSVTYVIDYTNSYIFYFSIAVLLVVFIYIFYRTTFFPTIRKEVDKGKKGYLVTLHVKGSRLREIKNVVVRDFVPSISHVRLEERMFKPKVRKVENMKELVWNVGKLGRSDERILHYTANLLMEAHVHLPKAELTFTSGGKKHKVFSNASAMGSLA